MTKKLSLNIAPITFSKDLIEIGRLNYEGDEEYRKQRESVWTTHAFRFDTRESNLTNVSIASGYKPIGDIETVNTQDHLLLFGKAIQQKILLWLADHRSIIRAGKKLTFWGGRSDALLLSQAVTSLGLQPKRSGV